MKTRKTRLSVSGASSNLVRVAYYILEMFEIGFLDLARKFLDLNDKMNIFYYLHYIRSPHFSYNLICEYTEIMSPFCMYTLNLFHSFRLEKKLESLLLDSLLSGHSDDRAEKGRRVCNCVSGI